MVILYTIYKINVMSFFKVKRAVIIQEANAGTFTTDIKFFATCFTFLIFTTCRAAVKQETENRQKINDFQCCRHVLAS